MNNMEVEYQIVSCGVSACSVLHESEGVKANVQQTNPGQYRTVLVGPQTP